MNIIQNITLDVNQSNKQLLVRAKQGDTDSRFLRCTIAVNQVAQTIPTTDTAVLCAVNPNEIEMSFIGTVNDDNSVTVPLDASLLATVGSCICSVSIFSGDTVRLTTQTFIVYVERAENASGEITVYTAITSLSAGQYYVMLNGVAYAFTTTQNVPAGGTIKFNGTLTNANTYNSSGAAIQTGLIVVKGAIGTQIAYTSTPVVNPTIAALVGNINTNPASIRPVLNSGIKVKSILQATETMPSGSKSPTNPSTINAITSTTVKATGKNVGDVSVFGGNLGSDGYYACASNSGRVLWTNTTGSDQRITVSYNLRTPSDQHVVFRIIYADGTTGNFYPWSAAYTTGFTSASGKTVSQLIQSYGSSGTFYIKDFQIEFGTVKTDYEPYVNLGSLTASFNALYKGYVDFASGQVVYEWKEVHLKSGIWTRYETNSFYTTVSADTYDFESQTTYNAECEKYPQLLYANRGSANYGIIGMPSGTSRILFIKDVRYDTVTEFYASLTSNDVAWCKLKTPVVVNIPPQTLRASLDGSQLATLLHGDGTGLNVNYYEDLTYAINDIRNRIGATP